MLSSFQRVILVLIGLSLGVGVGGAPYLSRISAIEQRAQVGINNQSIIVNVVRNKDDRAVGLSGRTSLNINEGMLFLFEAPGDYGFWMKDMTFPIDIVWIKDDTIIGVTERVFPPPQDTPAEEIAIHHPPAPANKVLEIAAGRAKLLHAKAGDTVEVRPFVPRVK